MGLSSHPAQQALCVLMVRALFSCIPESKTHPRHQHPCDSSCVEAVHAIAAPRLAADTVPTCFHIHLSSSMEPAPLGPGLSNAPATRGQAVSSMQGTSPPKLLGRGEKRGEATNSKPFVQLLSAQKALLKSCSVVPSPVSESSLLESDDNQPASRGSFRWQGRVAVTGSFPPL